METLSPSPPPGFEGRRREILAQESPVVPVVASTWHGPMVKPVPWGVAKQGGARGSSSQEKKVIISCLACLSYSNKQIWPNIWPDYGSMYSSLMFIAVAIVQNCDSGLRSLVRA